MRQKSYDNSPTAYIIPTPIGNLEDITIRAINTLKLVDVIFCEDTRVTGLLLKKYGIKKKMVSNHKFNEFEIKNRVIDELKSKKNIAILSDRGTPGISDPGFIAIKEIIDNGYNVVCLPGACAFLPALIMSGINPQPFMFYGFLDVKSKKRKEELKTIKKKEITTIIYEAPHRLKDTLKDILEVFGDIEISISREITKIYEEVIRDNISNIIKYAESLKGEFVIVLPKIINIENDDANIDIITCIDSFIKEGLTKSDAIKKVSKLYNISKNEVYNLYHKER